MSAPTPNLPVRAKLYTYEEVGELIQVNGKTAGKLIRQSRIKVFRPNDRTVRLTQKQLDKFLAVSNRSPKPHKKS